MNHSEVKEYREELKERVVRIETILERVEKHLETLNSRTGKLEDWRNWMLGGMACIGFALTLLGVL
jgi:DNA anti-recombination protein RmuC